MASGRRPVPATGTTHATTPHQSPAARSADHDPTALLALQRSVGNRAVTGALTALGTRTADESVADGYAKVLPAAAERSAVVLQRYEAGEHAQVGGKTDVVVNGVPMTQGEVNAMGDFFASASQLRLAPAAELIALRDLIRRDKDARTGKGGTPVSTGEWETATGGRYLKLAADNRAHFAPGKDGTGMTGTNHKAAWHDQHRQALFQAQFDGRFDYGKVSNSARTINAFANHFLTDAFSAGHLINKPEVMQVARERWNALATTGMIFKESTFTRGVAAAVLADPDAGPKLRAHELKIVVWGDVTPNRFSEFLWQVAKQQGDKFFNAFARIVHDHLDDARTDDPTSGVEVENDNGRRWRLSGDATLMKSPETLEIAQAAAAQAEANLAEAARGHVDLSGQPAAVWAFTPRPTKDGQKMIDETVASIADASKPESVTAFAHLTISEIDAGIEELTSMGYLRLKTRR